MICCFVFLVGCSSKSAEGHSQAMSVEYLQSVLIPVNETPKVPNPNVMSTAEKLFADDEQSLEFVKLVHMGDMAGMRKMVENGYDINTRGKHNMTPLYEYLIVVRPLRKDIFETFLELGANLTIPVAKERDSVLLNISRHENPALLKIAIDHGVDIRFGFENARPNMRTPLYKAVLERHLETVKILLEAGADPYAKNERVVQSL